MKRRAATVILGTVSRRLSSVTVPTTTTVLPEWAGFSEPDLTDEAPIRRERDMGGRLMRDMKRRRRTTLLKEESVRPTSSQSRNY